MGNGWGEDANNCRDFSPAEIACRGTDQLKLHPEGMDQLQALRDRLGKLLIVSSAYRSPEYNRAVSGAPRFKHMDGTAFDLAMANHDPAAFKDKAEGDKDPADRRIAGRAGGRLPRLRGALADASAARSRSSRRST